MIHEILPVGPLQCNCSIYGDERSREAIVIDPGDDVTDILLLLAKHALKVKAIVITHAHLDHVGGAQKLKASTGAPVYMNGRDKVLYDHLDQQAAWLGMETPPPGDIDSPLNEGDKIAVGQTELVVLHTPGHTQGSVSLWAPAEKKLFAGDTLFRDSIGRTDLPGGNFRDIMNSIRAKLMTLPEDAAVIPGHGDTTTIGREKRFNPFVAGVS